MFVDRPLKLIASSLHAVPKQKLSTLKQGPCEYENFWPEHFILLLPLRRGRRRHWLPATLIVVTLSARATWVSKRIPSVEKGIHGKTTKFWGCGPMVWASAEIGLDVVGISFGRCGNFLACWRYVAESQPPYSGCYANRCGGAAWRLSKHHFAHVDVPYANGCLC